MRIAFVSMTDVDFHAGTPWTAPLGGTESAACYLAEALAAGTGGVPHEVLLLSNTSEPGMHRGVHCFKCGYSLSLLRQLRADVTVLIRIAKGADRIRIALGPAAKLVLWATDDPTQASVADLKDPQVRQAFSAFVMVSEWQKYQYAHLLGVDMARMKVLRNAASPAFDGLYADGTPILPGKTAADLVLAYTSAPYRGLKLLLDVFPHIREAVPGTRLKVFSSMKVYRVDAATDAKDFGELYERCNNMAGVEYVGGVPQVDLARELKGTAVLAYTNIFPETSCIAAMEAMAAGCRLVSTELGALPETTAGFGELVEVKADLESYKQRFTEATIKTLREIKDSPRGVEMRLRKQVEFAHKNYTWVVRAREWTEWMRGGLRV